jgi:hypothetical protein
MEFARMPKVRPAMAIAVALLLHSAMTLYMFALAASKGPDHWGVTALAVFTLFVPGAMAGYLASRRPVFVGLLGAVLIASVQLLAVHLLVHAVTWSVLLRGLASDAMQGVVFCVIVVVAHHVRVRQERHSSSTVA